MRPPCPEQCPFDKCSGRIGYLGSYPRHVIAPDASYQEFGVHRFICKTCGCTVSFPPDFLVPYKHYGADVIQRVLNLILLLRISLRVIADPGGKYNDVGFSRFCLGQWLAQFACNSHNLWHFGLPRLFGADSPPPSTLTALLKHLVAYAVKKGHPRRHTFGVVQQALGQPFPPFGLFRAQLLPGCST